MGSYESRKWPEEFEEVRQWFADNPRPVGGEIIEVVSSEGDVVVSFETEPARPEDWPDYVNFGD